MSDENALTILESSDLENVGVTATGPAGLPHMQEAVLRWCRTKVARCRIEAEELRESVRIAELNDFKRTAFTNASKAADRQVVYYEKMLEALEAGYCIFPTTDVDLFAVRTKRRAPDCNRTEQSDWGRDQGSRDIPAQALIQGEGEYVGDRAAVWSQTLLVEKEQHDKSKKLVPRKFFYSKEFDDVEFPFEMRRPQIMRVTGEAMALKVFDEMGLLPARRGRGGSDPIIVGRIIHPRTKQRVSFLISWHIDTREL